MATKRRTRTAYTYSARSWMFPLSFWLVVIIGAAMAIVGIMHAAGISWNWFERAASYVQHVCMVIALIIPVCMSYQVARHKGTLWFVLWIIFVILVVVGIVTSLI